MSSIVTNQGTIHYEVEGRGEPVIFLHGWVGSWGCWRPALEFLTEHNQYRLYALDFWGFGESDKRQEIYHISDFVEMIHYFMNELGIFEATIIGHSMGGTVSMSYALDHPDRVRRVGVVGSPMIGSSLHLFLKLAGTKFIASLLWKFPQLLNVFLWVYSPWIANDAKAIYKMTMENISVLTLESFMWSINSLHNTDLRPRLHEIDMPTLGVYGAKDGVVNPNQAKIISDSIEQAQIEWRPNARHFVMLDEEEWFNNMLLEYLQNT